MRITSGNARGITLTAPRGDFTRPATDAARQAAFSFFGEAVCGARVLDLFAGTGSYGLEAASRGAKNVMFVESDRRAQDCIKLNMAAVKKSLASAAADVELKLCSADCFKAPLSPFDIVFADPPYDLLRDKSACSKIFALFKSIASLNPSTLFMLEAPAEFELVDNSFTLLRRLGKEGKGKPSQLFFRFGE